MKFFRRTSAGIDLQLAREHVHRALHEIGRLGTAGAAIRVGRRLVREDLGERRADGGDVVGGVGHHHRQRRDGRRQQHVVGADVGDEPELQAEHLAVAPGGEVDVADDVAAMSRGDERFGPILDPLDRNAQPLRDGGRDVLLGVDVDLRAEAAADFRGDRADLILAEARSSPRSSCAGCAGSASTTRSSSSPCPARSARRRRAAPSRSAPAAGSSCAAR